MTLIDRTPSVDLERERLAALVKLTYENQHYAVECVCGSCHSIRENVSNEDLEFLDMVCSVMRTSDSIPREV